jgi:lysophospholipid acyltransferase (LPLAT)-like uncharacterized protein
VTFRRRYKAARRRIGGWLLRFCGRPVVGALARTWKAELLGQEVFDNTIERGSCIACMWHGRMMLGMQRFGNGRYHVLVSPSRDGDLSQIILEAFGFPVIRGSSSRGGAKALRRMLDVLGSHGVVVITPDGPRGPRHAMNPGVAWMASETGLPIVPLGMVADRAWRLKSWDRFTIPKPGARVIFSFGEPISVARDASEDERARVTELVRERVIAAETSAFERLGVQRDW